MAIPRWSHPAVPYIAAVHSALPLVSRHYLVVDLAVLIYIILWHICISDYNYASQLWFLTTVPYYAASCVMAPVSLIDHNIIQRSTDCVPHHSMLGIEGYTLLLNCKLWYWISCEHAVYSFSLHVHRRSHLYIQCIIYALHIALLVHSSDRCGFSPLLSRGMRDEACVQKRDFPMIQLCAVMLDIRY